MPERDQIEDVQAAFGSTLALTVAAALASFGVLAALLHVVVPSTALPAPFPPQHQDAETLSFVLTFAVVLPLALWLVPRHSARIVKARGPDALSGLAAGLSVLLLGLVVAVKAADRLGVADGPYPLLAAAALWLLVAGVAVCVAGSDRGAPLLEVLAGRAREVWVAGLVLLLAAALAFVALGSMSVGVVVLGALAAAAVVYLYGRWSPGPLPTGLGRGIDAAAIVLLLLAVPNLVVFDLTDGFQTRIIDFHQGFFLGPASQVLHGTGMLVGTLSQYGVGSIYSLAAWFEVAPIGPGTLGFFEGVLSALVFASAYLTIRLTGASRIIAVAAMFLAVFALVFGLEYPLGGLLQHGAIRFGMPMIPLLAGTLELARPRYARGAQAAQLLALGVASIWALEAFAYTVLTVAAMLAVKAWLQPAGGRRRYMLRWTGTFAAACLAVHVVFAIATVLAYGELPDWGLYVNILREFLTGSIGDLTYDFLAWSPALAVGALYVASTAATVLFIRIHPDQARRRAPALIALAGSTAYGIALFSYFVNRSAGHILPYVCLPLVIAGAVWLGLLVSERDRISISVRLAGLSGALALGVILIATAWSGAGERFSQSALAYAIPGGTSPADAFDRLWNPPDLAPGATAGAETLEECMPGEDRSYVLTDADLGIEILDKAGRANAFPLADPWEDSFVPDHHVDGLVDAVDELQPGDRMLVDPIAIETFRDYRREPARDPLTDPFSQDAIVPTGIAVLQEFLLERIGERFDLRAACGSKSAGLPYVVELVPRS